MSPFEKLLDGKGQRCHVIDDGEPVELVQNLDLVSPISSVPGGQNPRDPIPQRVEQLEGRMSRLEKKVDNGFANINQRFDAQNKTIGEMNKKIEDGFAALRK